MFPLSKIRTLSEITKKIEDGTATVITVQELIDRVSQGENVKFEDVDVVTTATKGLMSGIMGVFSFRLSPPKTLRKFTEVSINGIQAFPGPCPNEYLGIVDLIVYGTAQSKTIENYQLLEKLERDHRSTERPDPAGTHERSGE